MKHQIILTSRMARDLKEHLLIDRTREQMAITLCGINQTDGVKSCSAVTLSFYPKIRSIPSLPAVWNSMPKSKGSSSDWLLQKGFPKLIGTAIPENRLRLISPERMIFTRRS